jgi:hypothetical protein
MKTIEHEGDIYILKSDMEIAIKDRISKVTHRAQTAEEQIRTLEKELESAIKNASISDTLAQQLEELREKLDDSQRRFDRYQAISQHGMVDADMVEAVEWSYERSQRDVPKKDRVSLTEWLDTAVKDPTTAPAILRPHLEALSQESAQAPVETSTEQITDTPILTQPRAPMTNKGAQAATDQPDLLTRAATSDLDFYADNRDAIMQAWRNRAKG